MIEGGSVGKTIGKGVGNSVGKGTKKVIVEPGGERGFPDVESGCGAVHAEKQWN